MAIAAAAASSVDGGGSVRMINLDATGLGAGGKSVPGADVQIRFDSAMDKVSGTGSSPTSQGIPKAMSGMFNALDQVDMQAKSVSDYAKTAGAGDGTLTPGEIVNLTMRCQEFMFQCQLTSNIANRSADGVQQLFRQQG